MTKMWAIDGDKLQPLRQDRLDAEGRIEAWLEADIDILDPALLVIGRQFATPFGGRIDLLAISEDGALNVIELKRDKTPREIVAQILDYASWVTRLDTPDVHEIGDRYWRANGSNFISAFTEKFGVAPPEPLNSTHNLLIVASALDPASQRIVEYLATEYGVSINTAFFNVFSDGVSRYLTADWLMDQDEVVERSERRTRAPWTGFRYVNVGEGEHRAWVDMRKHGFVAAGHGRNWSKQLERLAIDEKFYAYYKGEGYVGFGQVTGPPVMARDAVVASGVLLEQDLVQPNLAHDRDDPELADYIVPVRWIKTVAVSNAKTFSGIFATQHIVAKLSHPATLAYLSEQFKYP
jgi:hypothetical protein